MPSSLETWLDQNAPQSVKDTAIYIASVWNEGAYGLTFGEIVISVLIMMVAIALRGLFARLVVASIMRVAAGTKTQADDALVKSAAANGVGDAVAAIAPWAYKSDLWRYAAIWNTGGLFFDAEMELLLPPDRVFDLSRGGLQVVADRCAVQPCTEASRCV